MNDRLTVFVVADEPMLAVRLGRMAADAGFDVRLYDSAAALLDDFAQRPVPPGCVVLDAALADFGAVTVPLRLRREGALPPAIVVASYGHRRVAMMAMRAGAADIVGKPVDPDYLMARVRHAIHSHARRRVASTRKGRFQAIPRFSPLRRTWANS